jgi:hypothetical protein
MSEKYKNKDKYWEGLSRGNKNKNVNTTINRRRETSEETSLLHEVES